MSSQNALNQDIIIVGAGIVGLSIARELKQRYPDLSITLLEKEMTLGKHSSGRNSGVLHSGIYYPEGTLKAKVCVEGARELAAYCEAHKLPFNRVGKVILPVRPEDDAQIDVLHRRGTANGAVVEIIDAQQLKELEPAAHTVTGRALHSQNTAVFDPSAILTHLAKELSAQGVTIRHGAEVVTGESRKGYLVLKGGERLKFGYLFNTAGLYAERIAQMFHIGEQYRMLPFKGLYYQLREGSSLDIRGHIYPVPDLNVPFLGVHFTKTVAGKVTLGPTAIPAFGRENYTGLQGLDIGETSAIMLRVLEQYLRNQQGFRRFAHMEARRFLKPYFVEAAQALVPALKPTDLVRSQKVGIRAQLLDVRTHQLVMDFLVERAERSTHVLNAISPAFTSAFSFARFVLDNYFDIAALQPPESAFILS
jgi:L-2-hydroxyglutarate oxidase